MTPTQENHSPRKKDAETLSNLASGGTKQGGSNTQDDTKLQYERSASLPVDNHSDNNPTQKIKEIEKEIEKLNSLEKRKEGQLVTLPSTYKYELLKAKLSILKEWEAEDKRRIKELKEKMWGHPKTFEGIKCKTCLPLDYVEDIINEIFSLQEDGSTNEENGK